MSDIKLGDAILCYNSPDDARKAVESGLAHTPADTVRLVFDNSQDFRIGTFMRNEHPEIAYVRSPANIGCCVSRNRIAEAMIRAGCSHWVVRDQDVVILADGWLADMAAVFQQYPDTGIVSWECIAKQITPHYERKEGGLTPEIAGACCMVSAGCVRAVGGWLTKTLFMRAEDTIFCFDAGLKGFKTRLVLGDQKVAHPAPSGGMGRHPRCAAVQAESEAIFQARCAQFNYPKVPGVNAP
jgi:GT2 family glycosyltransferase